ELVREPIGEVQWIATDATAGVASTELLISVDNGPYELYGAYIGTSGTILVDLPFGEGFYHFYTVSVDNCDNREARPGYADASVVFDVTAPTSTVDAPEYATSLPIGITFSADDNLSGDLSTALYYNLDGGAFEQFGEPVIGPSGEFMFEPDDVEGTYGFYTRTTDIAGNVEIAPPSTVVNTIYDRSLPTSACTSEAIVTALPIQVDYTAGDTGPSGLAQVALWFKLDSGMFAEYTGGYGSAAVGSISFDPPGGLEGAYSFYTIAKDNAGNLEPAPGQGDSIDSKTTYDISAPESVASSETYTNLGPFPVYFVATDNSSGIASVDLYVKFGEAGAWGATGLTSSEASGRFDYIPISGEGVYYFYTVATDNAGFIEAVPAPVNGDSGTLFDSTAPLTILSGPTGVNSLPISLSFECVEPSVLTGAPIDTVVLYYRFNASVWMSTGLSHNAEAGWFNFIPTEGPGTYDFYTVGIDMAGNEEDWTAKLPTSVPYDVVLPTSGCTSDATYNQQPVNIQFAADGTGSDLASVRLWYKYKELGWTDWLGWEESINVSGPGENFGVFSFLPPEGDGQYAFYTVATDAAGNVQDEPSAETAPCSISFVDTVAPNTTASAPTWTTSSPIDVHFEGNDVGTGLAVVELWVQFDIWAWQKVDEKHGVNSGSFIYEPEIAGGTYRFYTIGRDLAGNTEAVPAIEDASTVFDMARPVSIATVPESSTNATIAIDFLAADNFSGVDSVWLWYRYGRGDWANTGLSVNATSGTFTFVLADGFGRYDFYSHAIDTAGNEEYVPDVPDGSCIYDGERPASTCWSAPYATELPLNIRYEARDDASGVSQVTLFYRFDGGEYKSAEMISFDSWGVFEFNAPDGEGEYEFYTLSTDNAGWTELDPTSPDTTTYYDITVPISTVSSPEMITGDTIPVFFTAWDAKSGVENVCLWYRFGDRDWTKSGHIAHTESGTIDFLPPDDVGTYSFWTVATDYCGNSEPEPTTGATVSAISTFDNVAPKSSVSSDVAYSNQSPIPLPYEASDRGVGIASVRLWYRVGGGAYKDTGLLATESTVGVFEFVPIEGDGDYDFYTVAEDKFGNRETIPAAPDTSIAYDTMSPYSTAVSPDEVNGAIFTVGANATDILSPIASISLWYRYSATLGGDWTDWAEVGEPIGGQTGLFQFEAANGEGYYEFYSIATDAAGNIEQPPASADTTTQYRMLYPEIALSAESYNFGEVQIGASKFWQLFITNQGEAPLTVVSLDVDGVAFDCSSTTPFTINPGLTSFAPVVFGPTEIGVTSATLTIESNDPDRPEIEVALTGIGVEPSLLSVGLACNADMFYSGDNMRVSISGRNKGETVRGLDLYISIILPTGDVVFFPSFTGEPSPYLTNFDMPAGLSVHNIPLADIQVPSSIMPGEYMWRAVLTRHLEGENLLASVPLVTTIDLRPELELSLNNTYPIYDHGAMQVLSARLRNDGLTKTVDLYVALQAPDGTLAFGQDLAPELAPFFDDYVLPRHADVCPMILFNNNLRAFGPGQYKWFVAVSDADSFNLISSIAQVEWVLE
ncbi:choice-of-anchor D domain-containing protein, partial [bacterium]|nr:choice-of-anchor D domain-containing protein [bacterium]